MKSQSAVSLCAFRRTMLAALLLTLSLLLAGCATAPKANPAPVTAAKPAPAVAPAVAPPVAVAAAKPPKRVPPPNPGEMEEAASKRSPVIGSKATAFALPDPEDKVVNLSDFGGKWTVVYFYPADDTPGCTCQATEFTDLLTRFHNLNAVVIGISPDPPVLHALFVKKYDLKLMLLSDTTRQTMKAYGAAADTQIGDQKVQRVLRSTFLIDPNGVIAYHWPEVIPEGHAERVRDRLAQLIAARDKKTSSR